MKREGSWNRASFVGHSNIALVKYWGKTSKAYDDGVIDPQIPLNPSLSFTLKHAKTFMDIQWREVALPENAEDKIFSITDFLFEQSPNVAFAKNLTQKINRLSKLVHWKCGAEIKISSSNTFPHSSGIASSASSMSCLSKFLRQFLREDTLDNAAQVARILSGSASRSLYPGFVSWEEKSIAPVESQNISPLFKNLKDCILIVDSGAKEVSSSQGHETMQNHPFMQGRIDQAKKNFGALLNILKSEDFFSFAELIESEALSLHAMMMSSNQSYLLLRPNTLTIIDLIRKQRLLWGWKVSFTLDAGANVHLIYSGDNYARVIDWVERSLTSYLEDGKFFDDEILWS
ncbi:MAG: hypothetical protein QE271_02300 [Bacteriovoracaceae bacterium]|nr:hypothetical protein [Bacteriovoracaceae bacterium]